TAATTTTLTSTATSTSAVVATEALIMGEVGAASPPASRRVPSSAVPLPVRPIRPRHTRTRLVHTQITRTADFERRQHHGRRQWVDSGSSPGRPAGGEAAPISGHSNATQRKRVKSTPIEPLPAAPAECWADLEANIWM